MKLQQNREYHGSGLKGVHSEKQWWCSPFTGRVVRSKMALTCAATPTAGYRVVTAYPCAWNLRGAARK